MNEKISIIVPIYNSELYIEKCLSSILSQSYKNIEVILIDDGSTDKSLEICYEFARSDNRIIVKHTVNQGALKARIEGIKIATGELVIFVDSDDWIDVEHVQTLFDLYKITHADLITTSFYKQFGSESVIQTNGVPEGLYSEEQLKKTVYPNMLSTGTFFRTGIKATLCAKLYRKKLLEIVFGRITDTITNAEDVAVVYTYLLLCKSMYISNHASYYYVQLASSLSQMEYKREASASDLSLYRYLKKSFTGYSQEYELIKQLNQFMGHFLLQRDISIFDSYIGQCRCFGPNTDTDVLAIYGAGRFGKQLF